MTQTIELATAQLSLAEIVAGLSAGDEVVLVRDSIPVAKLVAPPEVPYRKAGNCKGMITILADDNEQSAAQPAPTDSAKLPRQPGLLKGQLTIVSEDDEYLQDFAEYL